MAKLSPPVIENAIPASYNENGMVKITIPFSMNRTVIASQVGGFELKIKTIQTGSYLYTVQTLNPTFYKISEEESYVIFYFEDVEQKLKVGQFYKVQLAYLQVDELDKSSAYNDYIKHEITLEEYEEKVKEASIVGYYSTTSIMKYTTKPKIYINNFQNKIINNYTHSYTGYYDQTNGDITEKVYSYCFNIYDENKALVFTSGECLHNSSNDTNPNFTIDQYSVMSDLQYYKLYYIDYTITTINKLRLTSPRYKMMQRETIDPEIDATLEVNLNFNNSYIDVFLKAKLNDAGKMTPATGSFILTRADETSNYAHWEELKRFKIYETYPEGLIFRDFNIEQGKKYQYSLQQFNNYDLFSKRLYSNIVTSDYEDAFLFDSQRQLKIRYNAKMNKFTNTVLENKQNTIGNQFPFIFRNGSVNYKEFPISGLISYFMDEEHLFLSPEKLLTDEKTINYTTENIAQERIFKMEVLNWLNNGQPKVFKSPTEGNFIVRLMKINLQPETKLGRLLHNFNCNAYEIAEYNNANLQKLNFINTKINDVEIYQSKTINLSGYSPNSVIFLSTLNGEDITSFRVEDMLEGDIINVTYKDQSQQSFIIGQTGNLYLENLPLNIAAISIKPRYRSILKLTDEEFEQNKGLYYIYKKGKYIKADVYNAYLTYYQISNNSLQGLITYSYKIKQNNQFSVVQSINYETSNVKQFIGEHDILKEICSITDEIINPKVELTELYYIKVSKRPVDRLITTIVNEETLEDSGEFYYGAINENQENRSERFPLIELMYPIGLRPYEPCTYYVKDKDTGIFNKETDLNASWDPNEIYYLKGRYVKTARPVGLVDYNQLSLWIKTEQDNEEVYQPAIGSWQKGIDYYQQYTTVKGKIFYVKIPYVTEGEDFIFKVSKFYRKTTQKVDGKTIYTIAKKFNPQFYQDELYFILDEKYNEYVNAYVTIDNRYVYEPYKYYLHIVNNSENNPKDNYVVSGAVEFNINELNMEEGDQAECEGDVLKYYKMKNILPHILHQVGTSWDNIDNKPGYANPIYNFTPKKYKDFYNNKDYLLTEYQPYIEINGEKISVDETIFFDAKRLRDMGKITSFTSGNGVVVEVVYQIKNYNYIIENALSERSSYDKALEALDTALGKLSLDKNDKEYIDLSDMTEETYSNYYNNIYHKNVQEAYRNLGKAIQSSLQRGDQ